MTETLPLTEFLLARLADDEKWAQVNATGKRPPLWTTRVLADVAAKRAIVAEYHAGYWADPGSDQDLTYEHDGSPNNAWIAGRMIRLLALPYADHPDYRDEWRA